MIDEHKVVPTLKFNEQLAGSWATWSDMWIALFSRVFRARTFQSYRINRREDTRKFIIKTKNVG